MHFLVNTHKNSKWAESKNRMSFCHIIMICFRRSEYLKHKEERDMREEILRDLIKEKDQKIKVLLFYFIIFMNV